MTLVPEKRLDRNGRLVTKHVRATAARPAQAAIPAPAATPAPKTTKVPVARTRPVLWDVYKSQCGADKELVKASDSFVRDLNYYFEVSDVEAYDVMSRVLPENVIPLLACGVRSGEDAVTFLKDRGLERLIEDNTSFAEQALAHGIPAKLIKDFRDSYPEDSFEDNPSYFEAASIFGVKGFRESQHIPRLPEMVLNGYVNSDDLKTLGPKRVKAGGSSRAIITQLEKINNGQSKMTVEELGEVIDKAVESGVRNSTMVNESVWLADKRGPELTLKLKQPVLAAQLDQQLEAIQFDQSNIEAILLWHDEFRKRFGWGHVSVQQIKELFEAGIKSEDAAERLDEGMSTQQIIGVHAHEVPKAVSGGWL